MLGALDNKGLGAVDGQGAVDVGRRRKETVEIFGRGISMSQLLRSTSSIFPADCFPCLFCRGVKHGPVTGSIEDYAAASRFPQPSLCQQVGFRASCSRNEGARHCHGNDGELGGGKDWHVPSRTLV